MFSDTVLSSCCENTGPVTSGYVKSSQISNEAPLQLYKGFSFMPEQVKYFYFLETKLINAIKIC